MAADQRSFIKILVIVKRKIREIYRSLSGVYGEECFSEKKNYNSLAEFSTTILSRKENPRSGNTLTL